mmetsp:Transcript_25659/g.62874  ORF Transcript_25659/g.62874 Transcript_25659/m.62874 type:complete len:89 (-) Transcript_25659:13-279(-)
METSVDDEAVTAAFWLGRTVNAEEEANRAARSARVEMILTMLFLVCCGYEKVEYVNLKVLAVVVLSIQCGVRNRIPPADGMSQPWGMT